MIKAFGDYIVLKPLGEQKSKSGIIDPDSSNSCIAKQVGEVTNQLLVFEKGSEQVVKWQDQTYLLVHKDKIKAILED